MLERSSTSSREFIGSESEARSIGSGAIRVPGDPGPKRLGGLVLSRRLGQAVVIGGEVEVLVADLKPNGVRLKVTAPRSVPIHRREVFDSIKSAGRPDIPRAGDAEDGTSPREGRGSLVLTRHVGERVMIGDAVEVDVADIRSGAARLRINAPREIAVHRREIQEAIGRAGSVRPGLEGDPGP